MVEKNEKAQAEFRDLVDKQAKLVYTYFNLVVNKGVEILGRKADKFLPLRFFLFLPLFIPLEIRGRWRVGFLTAFTKN